MAKKVQRAGDRQWCRAGEEAIVTVVAVQLLRCSITEQPFALKLMRLTKIDCTSMNWAGKRILTMMMSVTTDQQKM